jgi:hypothetical protein
VLAAYVDGEAQPQLSFRGTTQVHDTGRLTIREARVRISIIGRGGNAARVGR